MINGRPLSVVLINWYIAFVVGFDAHAFFNWAPVVNRCPMGLKHCAPPLDGAHALFDLCGVVSVMLCSNYQHQLRKYWLSSLILLGIFKYNIIYY